MVSVITWQTIYLNGIIHSFDLAKANMHVAEEKSVTHKTQNTRRAFLCVTDKRDNCSTYFLPGPAVQSICQQYSIFSFLTLF